jgi:hypothetical protein
MARLTNNMQTYDGNPIMLDDPINNHSSRNNKPIEVHCVYLDKFLGEFFFRTVFIHHNCIHF